MSQPEESSDAVFEARSRLVLEQSADELDARTRSRLTRSRQAALAELQRSRSSMFLRRWAPATGLAAAAALAFLVSMQVNAPVHEAALMLEDFELVADGENLDLLADIEFYAWLESEADEVGSGDQSG